MNKQNEIINGVFHSYLLINHCIQRRKLVPQDITRILYLMHMHSLFSQIPCGSATFSNPAHVSYHCTPMHNYNCAILCTY